MTYDRLRILESVSNLDPGQAEKVLEYIKGLSRESAEEASYKRFKHQAMQQIRMALSSEQPRGAF
jgi:hypothetical protein